MIEWILHRPPHKCDPSEIRVAEQLRRLEDSPYNWIVIWGYYYKDNRGTDREGDFLVLGPAGGLLVLEVKRSLPRHYPETGRWEGAGDSDPMAQLMMEWKGVISAINAAGDAPFVQKALCVPGVIAPPDVAQFQGIARHWLITGNDLQNWIPTWLRVFAEHSRKTVEQHQKRAVLSAFGQGSLPEEKRAFVDHTEQLFEQQFISRFTLLDQLSDNRQLMIRGGTGTGKTWHALEQAFRYAAVEGNGRVLFLTYNLALTAQLRRIVTLRKIDRGEVIVRGWEELFLELCDLAGKTIAPPPSGSPAETIRAFYEVELPRTVLEISRDSARRSMWPVFDSLVADEAQDHDTSWSAKIQTASEEIGGWWHIYQQLLVDGKCSPASIFHDPAQRPPFRASERFDPALLATIWSQPAHVRLQPAVRFTRPLWQFFHDHTHPATAGMIEALGNGDHLPEGPEPENYSLPADTDARDLIESILNRWRKSGHCVPSDVLILHAQSKISKSPLGDRRILAGHNLRECTEESEGPNTIRHTSIHKAKGLDAKAVIVIGMPPHNALSEDYDHYSWFMAVSRARQLLAVVATP